MVITIRCLHFICNLTCHRLSYSYLFTAFKKMQNLGPFFEIPPTLWIACPYLLPSNIVMVKSNSFPYSTVEVNVMETCRNIKMTRKHMMFMFFHFRFSLVGMNRSDPILCHPIWRWLHVLVPCIYIYLPLTSSIICENKLLAQHVHPMLRI